MQNKTLRKEKTQEGGPASIIWDADDPSIHSFELLANKEDLESGTMMTIATYYKERYNMPLMYPHMPAIFIKDGKQDAYFPIEFLFQAFGKVRGADMNQHILAFNDDFASTRRVGHLETVYAEAERMMAQTGQPLSTLLEQFNISVSNEPMVLRATVFTQPNIGFRGNVTKIPRDGSWDLRNAQFSAPAHLTSFAFLDLDGGDFKKPMGNLFEVMEKHGISIPRPRDLMGLVTDLRVVEKSRQPETVRAIAGGQQKFYEPN